jgi:hypothetical protein
MPITRRRWVRLVASLAAWLLWLPVCPSEASGGSAPYALIFGTVWSPDNRPVYGVRVKLRRADEKKFRWEASSDHRGEFAIRVPAAKADYVLLPDLKHAKDRPLTETRIHVEADERIDIGVHLPQ